MIVLGVFIFSLFVFLTLFIFLVGYFLRLVG